VLKRERIRIVIEAFRAMALRSTYRHFFTDMNGTVYPCWCAVKHRCDKRQKII